MDYNDIPVFIRVVETSSFTKAAHELGVQKSSVSRSLGRLESELGVRLLQRTTRRLGLTEAGQSFYDRVRGALTGFDEAAAIVRESRTEPRGLVRITAPPGAAELGLADAIISFGVLYPSVLVEVELSARIVDLVSEGFDLALRAGRLLDSSLIAKKVGTTDLVLLAAPAYLKRHGRPRTLAELSEHDCVLFRARAGTTTWTVSGPERPEPVEVHGRVNANETSFVLRATIAGAGIAALPVQIARDAVLRKELEVVLPDYHLEGADLHVVLPSSAFVPARVMLLRDHLVRELSAVAAASHKQCREKQSGRIAATRATSQPPVARERGHKPAKAR